jgi:hypothetical protein
VLLGGRHITNSVYRQRMNTGADSMRALPMEHFLPPTPGSGAHQ